MSEAALSTAPRVTVIPATPIRLFQDDNQQTSKRRVAAYARVSTDKDEQHNSFEAQRDYFAKYIAARSEWEFVRIYSDEAISGTSTKNREGFNEMVADALAGKIDLIVTKSVSRFARNTVDSLQTVRALKEKGVEIWFEKENIYTLDSKGELLITIMSSLAQEESRSLSENISWGHRKRMADGKVSLPYGRFLGYKRGENGLPEIVKSEAAIVRLIYKMYLQGNTSRAIAKHLTEEGVPTPGGKAVWLKNTVESILTNEKYSGNALLQKGYTIDFLTKKRKVNNGEKQQFYVENSHPAIISPDEFDLVQQEVARRKGIGRSYSGASAFSTKLVCSCCGHYFGSKVWHSTDQYRRVIWRCNKKFEGGAVCATPHLTEETIKERFLAAYNQLMVSREQIITDCRLAQAVLADCAGLESELAEVRREMEVVEGLAKKCIEENASTAMNQDDYATRYAGYAARYDAAKERARSLERQRAERKGKRDALDGFIAELERRDDVVVAFDEALWREAVEKVTVDTEGKLAFSFKNGMEITI